LPKQEVLDHMGWENGFGLDVVLAEKDRGIREPARDSLAWVGVSVGAAVLFAAPLARQFHAFQVVCAEEVPGLVHQRIKEVDLVLDDFDVKESDGSILFLGRVVDPLDLARAVVEPCMLTLEEEESTVTIGFEGTDVPVRQVRESGPVHVHGETSWELAWTNDQRKEFRQDFAGFHDPGIHGYESRKRK
jgi:hypothetical protein